ncbi:MAG: hypothetical protein COB67_11555 [SAR324 cluster bacterium]|uniref:Uncharacterized protein n=1 Tax=SAR324 cluster bacterium TaxID=2024889 RepID=A0A2A4SUR9_9DELT|nr:MAG: hypothetical protein COB67_11555 [SAR324 cluster bacterium]
MFIRKLSHFFGQPQFQGFAFILFLFLLNWPFLGIIDHYPPKIAFFLMFGLWMIMLGLLFAIGRSCIATEQEEFTEQEELSEQLSEGEDV